MTPTKPAAGRKRKTPAVDILPGVQVSVGRISDFTPDPNNLNDHTQRGHSLLTREIKDNGMGRSMLVSADDVTLAGNLTQEVTQEVMGDTQVLVVRTDGRIPIVHQRTDIKSSDRRAFEMAIADNVIAKVSLNINPAALAQADPSIIERYYFASEIAEVMAREGQAGGNEIALDLDTTTVDLFAEGEQFSVNGFRVEIALTNEQYNTPALKKALYDFCKRQNLILKIRRA